MSESSIAIAELLLSGVLDHIDLDSHYNLSPDPPLALQWKMELQCLTKILGMAQLNKKHMLQPSDKLALFMPGHLKSEYGKMGFGIYAMQK